MGEVIIRWLIWIRYSKISNKVADASVLDWRLVVCWQQYRTAVEWLGLTSTLPSSAQWSGAGQLEAQHRLGQPD